jgi:hypothetical protein
LQRLNTRPNLAAKRFQTAVAQSYTDSIMWPKRGYSISLKTRIFAVCVVCLLALALRLIPHTTLTSTHAINTAAVEPNRGAFGALIAADFLTVAPTAPRPATSSATLSSVALRWDAAWSADVAVADANVANLHIAQALIARTAAGDLEATVDLIAAASWCLSGGPLVTITDGNASSTDITESGEPLTESRRPCYERFGESLASRAELERAVFAWVLRLAAAGVDDAALYASALIRGTGPDLLSNSNAEMGSATDVRQTQRELLLSQLQTLAERGSAAAASELHSHWSGDSAFHLRDPGLANYYALLTERLDPTRSLALVTP